MLYFANPVGSAAVEQAMVAGALGFIDTPRQRNPRPAGVIWCADNGCFSKRWDAEKWWAWLRKHSVDAATCRFAVAPDVVGDAAATRERALPWMWQMRLLGYRVAYVAQDGATVENLPWEHFDGALFIGGSTEFKLGPAVPLLVAEAKRRGLWVHMGRVNSGKRLAYAREIGCDSVDGTFLTFAPDHNLGRLRRWPGMSEHFDRMGVPA